MCGICGRVSLNGRRSTAAARGDERDPGSPRPGQRRHVVDGTAGLAARRLAIIDLETGDQPLTNEDGTVAVVQNGEIYNYRELRARAASRGHTLPHAAATPRCSSTSTRSAGRASSSELRGMFAIAIWDAPRRRLVLARDRFGIKPLYYRLTAACRLSCSRAA